MRFDRLLEYAYVFCKKPTYLIKGLLFFFCFSISESAVTLIRLVIKLHNTLCNNIIFL